MIVSLLIVLEARVTLLREEAGALAPVPVLFIMPERLLRLITAAEYRPPGAEVEPDNYQQIPTRDGLNGNKSIRSEAFMSKLFQSTPGGTGDC